MKDSFGKSPADSLSEEHKAIRVLTELLTQEQTYLIEANIDALAALTEPKAIAAARMAELAAWRHQALGAAGFAPQESGMLEWVKSPGASATAHQSWQELIELADAAKELNRLNGSLINQQMVRNQNVLNLLQNGSLQNNNVYGPNGQTTNKPTVRHIVAS